MEALNPNKFCNVALGRRAPIGFKNQVACLELSRPYNYSYLIWFDPSLTKIEIFLFHDDIVVEIYNRGFASTPMLDIKAYYVKVSNHEIKFLVDSMWNFIFVNVCIFAISMAFAN